MREFLYKGQPSYQYENIKEAWDAHFQVMHGEKAVSSEMYHTEYRAFLSGVISGINIASVKYSDHAPKMGARDSVSRAHLETLAEALNEVKNEVYEYPPKQ